MEAIAIRFLQLCFIGVDPNLFLQRDPITGEYATPDVVWELQHTRKNKEGETLWSDPKSQEIHVLLFQVYNFFYE